jgi:hypothetical protein
MFYDSGSSLRGFENAQLDEMALSRIFALSVSSRLVSSRLGSTYTTMAVAACSL